MKRANHFPNVWPVKRYCFFWSRPTTVSQEKFSPTSYVLAYQVCVFLIMSNCTLVEFLPWCNDARTVVRATPSSTQSPTLRFPKTGRMVQ
jgi:hypothetical protein